MYQTTKKRASGPKYSVIGKRTQGVCSVCVYIYIYIFVFWCIGSFAKFENVCLIYSYMLCQFVIVILLFVNL